MNDTAHDVQVMIPSSSGNRSAPPSDKDLVGADAGKIGLPSEAGSADARDAAQHSRSLQGVRQPDGLVGRHEPPEPAGGAALPALRLERGLLLLPLLAYAGTTSYLGSSSYSYRYQIQPTATCVRLPKCTDAVTKDKRPGRLHRRREVLRLRLVGLLRHLHHPEGRPSLRAGGVPQVFDGLAELRRQLDGGLPDAGQREQHQQDPADDGEPGRAFRGLEAEVQHDLQPDGVRRRLGDPADLADGRADLRLGRRGLQDHRHRLERRLVRGY